MAKREVRWAFWAYDLYPFVLAGPVVGRMDSEGRVEVDGYGGMRFKPLRIIEGYKGAQLAKDLNALRKEYQEAQMHLSINYKVRALKAAPFLQAVGAYRGM